MRLRSGGLIQATACFHGMVSWTLVILLASLAACQQPTEQPRPVAVNRDQFSLTDLRNPRNEPTFQFNLAWTAHRDGDFAKAVEHYRLARQNFSQNRGGINAAKLHLIWAGEGLAYMADGNLAAAEEPLRRSLEIQTSEVGDGNPATFAAIDRLAQWAERTGNDREAGDLYKRALQMLEKTYGPNNARTEYTARRLREVATRLGRSKEARGLAQRIADIEAATSGYEAEAVVRAAMTRGRVNAFTLETNEAIALQQQVARFYESSFHDKWLQEYEAFWKRIAG